MDVHGWGRGAKAWCLRHFESIRRGVNHGRGGRERRLWHEGRGTRAAANGLWDERFWGTGPRHHRMRLLRHNGGSVRCPGKGAKASRRRYKGSGRNHHAAALRGIIACGQCRHRLGCNKTRRGCAGVGRGLQRRGSDALRNGEIGLPWGTKTRQNAFRHRQLRFLGARGWVDCDVSGRSVLALSPRRRCFRGRGRRARRRAALLRRGLFRPCRSISATPRGITPLLRSAAAACRRLGRQWRLAGMLRRSSPSIVSSFRLEYGRAPGA
mmetsp:Transcript_103880/g.292985  ORF Transcript_103880/g.292985 Transcript_103880/m.292985 type:complete len:267 (-) Transcript_103880:254-1054(-)